MTQGVVGMKTYYIVLYNVEGEEHERWFVDRCAADSYREQLLLDTPENAAVSDVRLEVQLRTEGGAA